MTHHIQINPAFSAFLESFKGFRRTTEEGRTRCSIRINQKQLWLIAYRAQEATGRKFSCQGPGGTQPYPAAIPVGQWDDGSAVTAEATENKINGPFWIQYTESFNKQP